MVKSVLVGVFNKTYDTIKKAYGFLPDWVRSYVYNIFLWLDQGINVLGAPVWNLITWSRIFGYADEHMSSAMGKAKLAGKCWLCWPVCKLLDFLFREKQHCVSNIEYDEGVVSSKTTGE